MFAMSPDFMGEKLLLVWRNTACRRFLFISIEVRFCLEEPEENYVEAEGSLVEEL